MGTTATQKRSKARSLAKRGENPVAELRAGNFTNSRATAALVPVDKPLTAQQKAFALAVGQGDSIPNAMVRAGFEKTSTTYGYRMMAMPNIQAAVAAEKAKFEAANNLSRKRVFDMHMEAFDMAKLMSEPATMVAAAREIGKMAGYYEPQKKEINVNLNHGVMGDLNSLSTEELVRMVEMAARAGAAAVQAIEHDEDEEEGA